MIEPAKSYLTLSTFWCSNLFMQGWTPLVFLLLSATQKSPTEHRDIQFGASSKELRCKGIPSCWSLGAVQRRRSTAAEVHLRPKIKVSGWSEAEDLTNIELHGHRASIYTYFSYIYHTFFQCIRSSDTVILYPEGMRPWFFSLKKMTLKGWTLEIFAARPSWHTSLPISHPNMCVLWHPLNRVVLILKHGPIDFYCL